MADFRNNQLGMLRPVTDLIATRTATIHSRVWGDFTLGRTGAIQSQDAGSFSETSQNILTQVIDWPYAADAHGHAFDQANLWGVRNICYMTTSFDPSPRQDRLNLTAVPKILPAGYIWRERCGNGIRNYSSTLKCGSGNPYGISSVFWRDTNGDAPNYPTGYLWIPANLNQLTCDASFGPSVAPFLRIDTAGHVGFRNGTATVSAVFGASTNQTTTIYIGWDTIAYVVTSTNLPRNIVWSSGPYTAPAPASPLTVNIGQVIGGTDGTPSAYYIWCVTVDSVTGPVNSTVVVCNINMAPRTDIPLHYSASTGTNYAPGGIIP